MSGVLAGKTVMMTGAGRGMGRAMSIGLARAGAKVAMIDIDEDVLKEAAGLVDQAGGQGAALPMRADVTDAKAAEDALARVVARFGRVDVLVNDAVVGPERIGPRYLIEPPKFWSFDDRLFREMLTVNIFGPQLMARVLAPHMIRNGWGRIINVTTSLDTMYRSGVGAYGPTKAALEAMTRIMAQDLEGTGVSANVLVPGGPVNTRMIDPSNEIPRDKLIQPEVMVRPIVWLASADSDGINATRFIAAQWDESLPRAARIAKAGAPVAWPQLGAQAIIPS